MTASFRGNLLEGLRGKLTNLPRLAGNLIDRFEEAIREYGCDQRDELIVHAKSVYDELASMVNIPLVKEPLESQLEQEFWTDYIQPTLEGLANSLCGPKKST